MDYREINRIVNGLINLRVAAVNYQHQIAIDSTNHVNASIIRHVHSIDILISKMEKYLEQIDGNEPHIPPDDNNG